jgi:hypothetical protein
MEGNLPKRGNLGNANDGTMKLIPALLSFLALVVVQPALASHHKNRHPLPDGAASVAIPQGWTARPGPQHLLLVHEESGDLMVLQSEAVPDLTALKERVASHFSATAGNALKTRPPKKTRHKKRAFVFSQEGGEDGGGFYIFGAGILSPHRQGGGVVLTLASTRKIKTKAMAALGKTAESLGFSHPKKRKRHAVTLADAGKKSVAAFKTPRGHRIIDQKHDHVWLRHPTGRRQIEARLAPPGKKGETALRFPLFLKELNVLYDQDPQWHQDVLFAPIEKLEGEKRRRGFLGWRVFDAGPGAVVMGFAENEDALAALEKEVLATATSMSAVPRASAPKKSLGAVRGQKLTSNQGVWNFCPDGTYRWKSAQKLPDHIPPAALSALGPTEDHGRWRVVSLGKDGEALRLISASKRGAVDHTLTREKGRIVLAGQSYISGMASGCP